MSEIILKLQQGAKLLNLDLNLQQAQQIQNYLALLQKWNRVFNLTAITKPQEMLTHHVFDSLAVGVFLDKQRYLDVGTGAGLPGMMLAILFPEKQFMLLDSNSKKTSFIRQTAHQLGLKNVVVVTSRIENYHPDVLFDGVISRAFTSLREFAELCLPLVNEEGELLAMKGPKVFEELQDFAYDTYIEKVTVPFLEEERYLIKVKR